MNEQAWLISVATALIAIAILMVVIGVANWIGANSNSCSALQESVLVNCEIGGKF